MVQTLSTMLPLGTKAPHFELWDACSNTTLSLGQIKSNRATVIMFLCNHCPYVKHIQTKLIEIAKKYQAKHISFVAINSNNVETYPADSPECMQQEALIHGYTFPYLYDESQTVAKAYHAACTPDFYIFDQALLCVYRGRFDDSTLGNGKPATGKDICTALDALLDHQPIPDAQFPSLGCNIKWRR